MDDQANMQSKHPLTIFENFHKGLVQIHDELRQGANAIFDSFSVQANDAVNTDRYIFGFSVTLLNHHKAEDRFFFPAFRAAGRLRSNDVAFLDARDSEHRDIHRLCLELRDLADRHQRGAIHNNDWRNTAKSVITDLSAVSLPHFQIEEATLTAEYVATMITPGELTHVYRDMGENWNRG